MAPPQRHMAAVDGRRGSPLASRACSSREKGEERLGLRSVLVEREGEEKKREPPCAYAHAGDNHCFFFSSFSSCGGDTDYVSSSPPSPLVAEIPTTFLLLLLLLL